MAHRAKKVPVSGIGPTTRCHPAEINECHAIVRVQAVGCKSMNHAQKYLAQANRQIAELVVQIAHQRVIVKHALDTGQHSEMAKSLLDALEGSLRIFESHRIFLLSSIVNRSSKRII
jgi:hypothetical protein